MNGNMHFPSMAAHSLYVAPSLAPQTQPNTNMGMSQPPLSAAMPGMHANPSAAPIRSERTFVPKRGRSSDMSESSDSMDHDGPVEEQQRCIYYRKSIAFISAKRAKAVVETQV
ncbi:hypothetical protein J3B02_001807 [Coemansia erecta]|uniref:Uncharacterized protein n=1 Tax=Coemansia asiatica TaxID=1052880 RepID=A0A9W7XLA5_9FUNG|nr:hypothetical protein LPJ64_001461 [Coemansia asiatica]KAJ2856083.1 hypothetical protein J3B02_001807 [Coemansia erecta]KAJ2888543.1 hypothetical protein FB639_000568 [Coemansia asiatica]